MMKVFKSVIFFFSFLIALALGLSSGAGAFAVGESVFDKSNVCDDLKGANFVLESYPKNLEGELQLIYFAEYGYSYSENKRADYGLYLYIYNPAELAIDRLGENYVEMASKYDENGKPCDYAKYELKCVSMSSSVYGMIFYKFKINAGLNKLLSGLRGEERRYAVSGLELDILGEANATEFSVGVTFIYTGYAQGYGEDVNAESTLFCEKQELETICLDVRHTTYKYFNSVNKAQEVATAYFAVPNKYLTEYGSLQKIKAEWIECTTNPILITDSRDFFAEAEKLLGVSCPDKNPNSIAFAEQHIHNSANLTNYYYWSWNSPLDNDTDEYLDVLSWLILTSSIEEGIAYEKIIEYMGNHLELDLFSSVSEKIVKEFDAEDDKFDLIGAPLSSNPFKSLYYVFHPDIQQGNLYDLSPIEKITTKSFSGNSNYDSKKLLIDSIDLDDIKKFCSESEAENKTVFLFRFALNDYSVEDCNLCWNYHKVGLGYNWKSREGLKVETTVYKDFDIIWLGFLKEKALTIIPAVSNPINIVGNIDPPKDDTVIDKVIDEVKDDLNNLKDNVTDFFDDFSSAGSKFLNILKWTVVVIGGILLLIFVLYIFKLLGSFVKVLFKKDNK